MCIRDRNTSVPNDVKAPRLWRSIGLGFSFGGRDLVLFQNGSWFLRYFGQNDSLGDVQNTPITTLDLSECQGTSMMHSYDVWSGPSATFSGGVRTLYSESTNRLHWLSRFGDVRGPSGPFSFRSRLCFLKHLNPFGCLSSKGDRGIMSSFYIKQPAF